MARSSTTPSGALIALLCANFVVWMFGLPLAFWWLAHAITLHSLTVAFV